MTNSADKLLTIKEVALWLKLNPITLYEYIRNGSLKAMKFGRYYRVVERDLLSFIDAHKTKGGRA